MTDKEWFDRLNKVFNPNSPSVQRLRAAIDQAERQQEVTLDHYFNNGLKWSDKADSKDVEAVFNALRELRDQARTMAQKEVLGALFNDLPYKTNRDMAKLESRVNIARLGLNINQRLQTEQSNIVQRVTSLRGRSNQGYNSQLRRRALMRIAVQTGNDTDTLPLVFKHMQSLSLDLDRVIDYQVQNHMNPNSLKKAAKEALEANKQWNYKSDGWRNEVQKRYMRTKSDVERVFVTEAKVTQVKSSAKLFKSQGYRYVKVMTRDNPHTCRFCEGMDGTKVKIDEIQVGINVPPFHPRCACNIIPTEGSWNDIFEMLDNLD